MPPKSGARHLIISKLIFPPDLRHHALNPEIHVFHVYSQVACYRPANSRLSVILIDIHSIRAMAFSFLVSPCLDFGNTEMAGERAGNVYPNPVGGKRGEVDYPLYKIISAYRGKRDPSRSIPALDCKAGYTSSAKVSVSVGSIGLV